MKEFNIIFLFLTLLVVVQRKLEEAQKQMQRKEKEFEETMDHLQADIDSLESERGELKEKLKNYTKKVFIEGMKSTVGKCNVYISDKRCECLDVSSVFHLTIIKFCCW